MINKWLTVQLIIGPLLVLLCVLVWVTISYSADITLTIPPSQEQRVYQAFEVQYKCQARDSGCFVNGKILNKAQFTGYILEQFIKTVVGEIEGKEAGAKAEQQTKQAVMQDLSVSITVKEGEAP